MSRQIPLKLDADKASALYLLIDIALRSLSTERVSIAAMQATPTTELPLEKLRDLIEHIDVLTEEGKKLALEVGALVDELEDDDEPFIPVIKSPL